MPTLVDLVRDPVSIGVIALYGALFAWERFFPARRLPRIRGWALRGSTAFVLYFLVSSYLPLWIAEPLAAFRLFDATSLGTVGGAAVVLLVYEALAYAWHRALHASSFLFRTFHQVHHSAERLDVPSAFWFGPFDMVGWTVVTTIALALIGLTPRATMLFVMISTFFGIFQHANIRTPVWLGYFIQRPENHSHHHARGSHSGNYANLSVFDMLFGTFRNAPEFAEATGYGDGSSSRLGEMLRFRDVSLS